MTWVRVHTVGVEKKGMLRRRKWSPSVDRAQASHVALLFSQNWLGCSLGGDTTGTFISTLTVHHH